MRDGRLGRLLASSSVAALLIGGGAPAAFAACANGAGAGSGFDNPAAHTTACVTVANTSFTGNITNEGTISPGGIAFTNGTMTGSIQSTGNIAGGISLDSHSTIANNITAISITGAIFAGGIQNNGQISSSIGAGINIASTTFVGDVVNTRSGVIQGFGPAIFIDNVVSYIGNVSNAGTLSGQTGILVCGCVSTFTGGIANTGTINVSGTAIEVEASQGVGGGISNGGTVTGAAGIVVLGVGTFLNGITNTGSISATAIPSGTGIAVLGTSTFTGGISNKGAITAGSNGILVGSVSSFGGGISNGGVISVVGGGGGGVGIDVVFVSLFSNGITNTGTITAGQVGIGVLGVGTFQNGITNTGGIYAGSEAIVVSAGVFGGHIVNTGTISGGVNAIDLTNNGSAVTIDQNAGLISGNILLSPNGDTLNIRGGTINGNIIATAANGTINFDLGAGTFTYGPAFHFGNLTQVNVDSGVVILNGANNAATNIAVNGGVLQVGDAANPAATLFGNVDVIGGTLSGHGAIEGAVTVENGGVLFPGGSIGVLVVANGALTFNAGSSYVVQIAPGAGNNSRTLVGSAPAVINGGTVFVLPQLGHYNATTYQILTSVGPGSGVNGTFTGLANAGPFTFTASEQLTYDTFDVLLKIGDGFALLAPAGTNQNQQSVVNGINNAILSGQTVSPQFGNLGNLSGPGLLNALSQLSGENNPAFLQGALQAGDSFLNLLLNPFVDGRFGNNGFGPATAFAAEDRPALPDAALAFAKVVKAPPRDATLGSVPQFRVWGAAYGGSGRIDGDATLGSHTTTASDAAFAAGVDYLVSPATTVGFALAGGGTSWSLEGGFGDGRSDMFQAGVYGTHRFANAYISGALAYNFHDVTTNRTVTVAGTDMLQARFQANGLGARIEGGYRVATSFARVSPYAAVQVQSFFLPAYGESATAGSNQFALNFASQTATVTRSEVGAWLDHSMLVDRGKLLTLYGRLAWAHDEGNTPNASAIFQALPGSNFIVNAATPARDGALVSAGVKYDLLNGWSFLAKFDGEFSSTTSIYSGTGMVRKTW
jgi:uncharacterized protein with beta-barrel porin domain